MKKQGSNKSQGARKRVQGGKGVAPAQVGRVNDQLTRHQIMRFVGKELSFPNKLVVTWRNLLDTWLFAVTATTGYDLFDLVRVDWVSVRATGSGAAVGVVSSVELAFPGSNTPGVYGDGSQFEGASIGTSEPAFVKGGPAKLSQTAQFHTNTTDTAFTIDVKSGGTISLEVLIEVALEFKNSAELAPQGAANALALATVGQLYFRGLDGQAKASTSFPSLFEPTI